MKNPARHSTEKMLEMSRAVRAQIARGEDRGGLELTPAILKKLREVRSLIRTQRILGNNAYAGVSTDMIDAEIAALELALREESAD